MGFSRDLKLVNFFMLVTISSTIVGCQGKPKDEKPAPVWIWTLERLPKEYLQNECLKKAIELAAAIGKSKKGQDALKKVNKDGVDLREELKDGTGPEIEVKEIAGNQWANYEGDSGGKEDAVFLDKSSLDEMLDLCKDEKKKNDAIIIIASQLLHETAHWKDDVKKHPDDDTNTPGEEGAQLEKDIFGGVLDIPVGEKDLEKDGAKVDEETKKKWADPDEWES